MIGLLHGFAQALATGLLAAYLVLMAVNLISGIAPRLRRWSMPAARQSKLNALFQLRSSGVGPLSFLAAVLKSFAWQIGWPALAIPMYKMLAGRKTDAEFSARLALSPQDLRVAIFDLALMVVVLTLVALQLGWYPLELATVGLVLAATAARHLGYLIGPLLPMLRRSRLNPVTNFFGIAVADVSTLIVGIAALFDSTVPLHPSLNDLAKAALDLVSVNKLIEEFSRYNTIIS